MEYVVIKKLEVMVKDVDALKEKVIREFTNLLCEVRKGYKLDYEFLLEEISFIDIIQHNRLDEKLSLIALQYYLNNKWQKQY